ncbi:MAG TPA: radical SAM protein, partial [Syntrophales bacterium]|nr:radical SAM protein [Syntrophales bacterium]
VLTGIHLGTYGYDLLPKVSLSLLIETILSRTKIKRIRLSSLEVREVDDQLIELIQEARVCKHLHIPLQSGDDRILMKMRRTYNSREFIDRINYLLSRVSGIAIGTDIIVGFPGESNEEFENTRAIVESIPFSYLHVFPFSARKGTEASKMPSGLDPETKRRRCLELRGLGSKKKMTYMKNQIGKTLDMLVEERDSSGACLGTTGNYLKVRAFVESACVKDIVPVRIARADELTLEGLPISKI